MSVDLDRIFGLRQELQGDSANVRRHELYDVLLDATRGNYYDTTAATAMWQKWQGIIYHPVQDSRDKRKLRITINVLNPIIEGKRSLWSVPPSLRCPYRDLSDEAVDFSNRLERTYRHLWDKWSIDTRLGDAGFFNVLLGTSVFGLWPDFEHRRPALKVRTPYGFYGVPGNTEKDGTEWSDVFFITYMTGRQASRMWPDVADQLDKVSLATVVEYWGREFKVTYLEPGHIVVSKIVANRLGFVPVVTCPNIAIPGRWDGEGDVTDAIPLVGELNKRYNMENQALSDMAGAPWEAVNLEEAEQDVTLDPDGINRFGAGGGMKKSGTNQIPYQLFQSNNVLRQLIDQVADYPEIMRSAFPGSGTPTGRGIAELSGPFMLKVQQKRRYLHDRLEIISEMAMRMWRSYWPGEHLIMGSEKGSQWSEIVDLRDFEGFYDIEVYLDSSAYFDIQSRLISGLQMIQNNAMSIQTFNEEMNPFVKDGVREAEQIRKELLERTQAAALAMAIAQSAVGSESQPQLGGPQMEQRALSGGTMGALPPAPPPPGVNPHETPPPQLGPARPGPGPAGDMLERLADLVRSVPNVKGQVFLTGSILEGEVGPDGVEMWFTEMLDWATVRQVIFKPENMPELKGKITPYPGEPQGGIAYLEVTPGTSGYEPTGAPTGQPEMEEEMMAPMMGGGPLAT